MLMPDENTTHFGLLTRSVYNPDLSPSVFRLNGCCLFWNLKNCCATFGRNVEVDSRPLHPKMDQAADFCERERTVSLARRLFCSGWVSTSVHWYYFFVSLLQMKPHTHPAPPALSPCLVNCSSIDQMDHGHRGYRFRERQSLPLLRQPCATFPG